MGGGWWCIGVCVCLSLHRGAPLQGLEVELRDDKVINWEAFDPEEFLSEEAYALVDGRDAGWLVNDVIVRQLDDGKLTATRVERMLFLWLEVRGGGAGRGCGEGVRGGFSLGGGGVPAALGIR